MGIKLNSLERSRSNLIYLKLL